LSDLAVKHSKTAKKYGIDDVLDEMRHILIHELDYSREAQNLIALLGKNLEKFEHIVIPQPVLDYSTSKILTMDFVEGQKITSVHGIQKTSIFRCSLMNW
jgi:predicted unusual protein kinase regulating ubiquinone biosynthesis (AarF/ABC1/UbiB family)